MFQTNNIIEIGGLAATAINIIQSQSIHEHETSHAKKRHEESMALAQSQHEKDLKIAKQTYLMAAFTSLEQHFQQLNADLISSSKESESDMFDQRNQSFQTVILSASVMFSSLSTVIIQGFLPANADEFLFVSYALTSALSFAFLFLSIVLCIEVILRASSFMYNRARKHTTQLREAIQKTKMMMKRIRGGQFPDDSYCGEDGTGEGETKAFDKTNQGEGDENNQSKPADNEDLPPRERVERTLRFSSDEVKGKMRNSRRQIAEMKEEDLQMEWERHEAEVHKYLEEREKINDQTSVLVSADANSSRMSFEQFWRESCKFWADIAILFFYAGTANLLLAIMIYMWAEFFITYQSPVGAVIAVVFIGVSLVVGILLAIYLRQNDTYGKGPAARQRPHRVERNRGRNGDRQREDDINDDSSARRDSLESPPRPSTRSQEEKDESYNAQPAPLSSVQGGVSDRRRDGRLDLGSRGSGYETEREDSFWSTLSFSRHESESDRRSPAEGVAAMDHPLASANMVARSTHIGNAQTVPETPPVTPLNPITKKSSRSRDLRPTHSISANSSNSFY